MNRWSACFFGTFVVCVAFARTSTNDAGRADRADGSFYGAYYRSRSLWEAAIGKCAGLKESIRFKASYTGQFKDGRWEYSTNGGVSWNSTDKDLDHGEVASGPELVNDDGDIEGLRREAVLIIPVPPLCKARVSEVRQTHRPGAVRVARRRGDELWLLPIRPRHLRIAKSTGAVPEDCADLERPRELLVIPVLLEHLIVEGFGPIPDHAGLVVSRVREMVCDKMDPVGSAMVQVVEDARREGSPGERITGLLSTVGGSLRHPERLVSHECGHRFGEAHVVGVGGGAAERAPGLRIAADALQCLHAVGVPAARVLRSDDRHRLQPPFVQGLAEGLHHVGPLVCLDEGMGVVRFVEHAGGGESDPVFVLHLPDKVGEQIRVVRDAARRDDVAFAQKARHRVRRQQERGGAGPLRVRDHAARHVVAKERRGRALSGMGREVRRAEPEAQDAEPAVVPDEAGEGIPVRLGNPAVGLRVLNQAGPKSLEPLPGSRVHGDRQQRVRAGAGGGGEQQGGQEQAEQASPRRLVRTRQ